jgi:hypothetical protein
VAAAAATNAATAPPTAPHRNVFIVINVIETCLLLIAAPFIAPSTRSEHEGVFALNPALRRYA